MYELFDIVSVPAIASLVYAIIKLIRFPFKDKTKIDRFLPLIAAGLGLVCGIVAFYAIPSIMPADNVVVALLIGGSSGLTSIGMIDMVHGFMKKDTTTPIVDTTPALPSDTTKTDTTTTTDKVDTTTNTTDNTTITK